MQREYITNEAWRKIYQFLKKEKGIYVRNEGLCKRFIVGVYWILKTGAQWRELPDRYGNWNSVFKRFDVWSKKKIFEKLLTFCADDPDLEYVMIDATIVRSHPCAAGYGKQSEEGLGRSKGGFTTKIHATVDALGNPLKIIITPGQRNDITQAETLLKATQNSCVIADRGYDSDALRTLLNNQKCTVVIPPRSNRKIQYEYDEHLYKERHLVECFFSKIKHFRHVFSRFDKKAQNYLSFVSFVGAILWLR
ncbi:IS5 family transposase [bacterium]|nr:MAG: IS5 family transposase [bacterium]